MADNSVTPASLKSIYDNSLTRAELLTKQMTDGLVANAKLGLRSYSLNAHLFTDEAINKSRRMLEALGFTCDFWTGWQNGENYYKFTAHWTDSEETEDENEGE